VQGLDLTAGLASAVLVAAWFVSLVSHGWLHVAAAAVELPAFAGLVAAAVLGTAENRAYSEQTGPYTGRLEHQLLFDDELETSPLADGRVLCHHPATVCSGEHCVLHNPSDHPMKSWPKVWRGDLGLMERLCSHGVGHPDPDALAHLARVGVGVDQPGVHGCDGCCRPPAHGGRDG
jgi:hypothetical protein